MSKQAPQYYSLPLKKATNMITDASRSMHMFADTVKTLVERTDIDGWLKTPIPDYMDAYLNAKVVVEYIQKRIEDPDEAITEYLKKNNIEGLLFTKEELVMLHTLVTNLETTKEYLNKAYGFTTMVN